MLEFFRKKLSLRQVSTLDSALIRQRTSILVIDDDVSAFPVELFQEAGYNITHWNKVKSLPRLLDHTYDIIILDIMGVADDFSGDGLDVLKLIKKSSPSQLVIAFSGSKAVQTREEFWRSADSSLKKPIRFFDCKEYLDEFIDSHITLNSKWTKLRDELIKGNLTQKDIDRIEDALTRGIGGDSAGLDAIKRIISGNGLIRLESVIGLANSLIQLYRS